MDRRPTGASSYIAVPGISLGTTSDGTVSETAWLGHAELVMVIRSVQQAHTRNSNRGAKPEVYSATYYLSTPPLQLLDTQMCVAIELVSRKRD